MTTKNNVKTRVLLELKLLSQKTDEDHPLSAPAIIQSLADCGIEVERKAIYDDIKCIEMADYEIGHTKAADGSGYFMNEAVFDRAELRLLINAVRATSFLTTKQTESICRKLLSLTNCYNRQAMEKTIGYCNNKAANQQVMINIDKIQQALEEQRKITFRYFDLKINLQKSYRPKNYMIDPIDLVWDQERCYMVGYNAKHQSNNNYRVDKMEMIELTDEHYEKHKQDINAEMNQMVQMYSGPSKRVTMHCDAEMAGEMLDQFGDDMTVIDENEESFDVSVKAMITPTFFSWVIKFDGKITITGPNEVCEEMRLFLQSIIDKMPKDAKMEKQ